MILATHRLQNTPIHYYEHTEPGMPPPDNSLWEDSCYSVNDTVSSPWPTAILAVAALAVDTEKAATALQGQYLLTLKIYDEIMPGA